MSAVLSPSGSSASVASSASQKSRSRRQFRLAALRRNGINLSDGESSSSSSDNDERAVASASSPLQDRLGDLAHAGGIKENDEDDDDDDSRGELTVSTFSSLGASTLSGGGSTGGTVWTLVDESDRTFRVREGSLAATPLEDEEDRRRRRRRRQKRRLREERERMVSELMHGSRTPTPSSQPPPPNEDPGGGAGVGIDGEDAHMGLRLPPPPPSSSYEHQHQHQHQVGPIPRPNMTLMKRSHSESVVPALGSWRDHTTSAPFDPREGYRHNEDRHQRPRSNSFDETIGNMDRTSPTQSPAPGCRTDLPLPIYTPFASGGGGGIVNGGSSTSSALDLLPGYTTKSLSTRFLLTSHSYGSKQSHTSAVIKDGSSSRPFGEIIPDFSELHSSLGCHFLRRSIRPETLLSRADYGPYIKHLKKTLQDDLDDDENGSNGSSTMRSPLFVGTQKVLEEIQASARIHMGQIKDSLEKSAVETAQQINRLTEDAHSHITQRAEAQCNTCRQPLYQLRVSHKIKAPVPRVSYNSRRPAASSPVRNGVGSGNDGMGEPFMDLNTMAIGTIHSVQMNKKGKVHTLPDPGLDVDEADPVANKALPTVSSVVVLNSPAKEFRDGISRGIPSAVTEEGEEDEEESRGDQAIALTRGSADSSNSVADGNADGARTTASTPPPPASLRQNVDATVSASTGARPPSSQAPTEHVSPLVPNTTGNSTLLGIDSCAGETHSSPSGILRIMDDNRTGLELDRPQNEVRMKASSSSSSSFDDEGVFADNQRKERQQTLPPPSPSGSPPTERQPLRKSAIATQEERAAAAKLYLDSLSASINKMIQISSNAPKTDFPLSTSKEERLASGADVDATSRSGELSLTKAVPVKEEEGDHSTSRVENMQTEGVAQQQLSECDSNAKNVCDGGSLISAKQMISSRGGSGTSANDTSLPSPNVSSVAGFFYHDDTEKEDDEKTSIPLHESQSQRRPQCPPICKVSPSGNMSGAIPDTGCEISTACVSEVGTPSPALTRTLTTSAIADHDLKHSGGLQKNSTKVLLYDGKDRESHSQRERQKCQHRQGKTAGQIRSCEERKLIVTESTTLDQDADAISPTPSLIANHDATYTRDLHARNSDDDHSETYRGGQAGAVSKMVSAEPATPAFSGNEIPSFGKGKESTVRGPVSNVDAMTTQAAVITDSLQHQMVPESPRSLRDEASHDTSIKKDIRFTSISTMTQSDLHEEDMRQDAQCDLCVSTKPSNDTSTTTIMWKHDNGGNVMHRTPPLPPTSNMNNTESNRDSSSDIKKGSEHSPSSFTNSARSVATTEATTVIDEVGLDYKDAQVNATQSHHASCDPGKAWFSPIIHRSSDEEDKDRHDPSCVDHFNGEQVEIVRSNSALSDRGMSLQPDSNAARNTLSTEPIPPMTTTVPSVDEDDCIRAGYDSFVRDDTICGTAGATTSPMETEDVSAPKTFTQRGSVRPFARPPIPTFHRVDGQSNVPNGHAEQQGQGGNELKEQNVSAEPSALIIQESSMRKGLDDYATTRRQSCTDDGQVEGVEFLWAAKEQGRIIEPTASQHATPIRRNVSRKENIEDNEKMGRDTSEDGAMLSVPVTSDKVSPTNDSEDVKALVVATKEEANVSTPQRKSDSDSGTRLAVSFEQTRLYQDSYQYAWTDPVDEQPLQMESNVSEIDNAAAVHLQMSTTGSGRTVPNKHSLSHDRHGSDVQNQGGQADPLEDLPMQRMLLLPMIGNVLAGDEADVSLLDNYMYSSQKNPMNAHTHTGVDWSGNQDADTAVIGTDSLTLADAAKFAAQQEAEVSMRRVENFEEEKFSPNTHQSKPTQARTQSQKAPPFIPSPTKGSPRPSFNRSSTHYSPQPPGTFCTGVFIDDASGSNEIFCSTRAEEAVASCDFAGTLATFFPDKSNNPRRHSVGDQVDGFVGNDEAIFESRFPSDNMAADGRKHSFSTSIKSAVTSCWAEVQRVDQCVPDLSSFYPNDEDRNKVWGQTFTPPTLKKQDSLRRDSILLERCKEGG